MKEEVIQEKIDSACDLMRKNSRIRKELKRLSEQMFKEKIDSVNIYKA